MNESHVSISLGDLGFPPESLLGIPSWDLEVTRIDMELRDRWTLTVDENC